MFDLIKYPFRSGTPVNAKIASATLTFTNIANDSETVTVGDDTYEFDTDGIITPGNILVDVSGGTTAAATGILTFSGVVADGQTVTIGTDVFEFDTGDGVVGDNIVVDISGGVTADDAVTALTEAININATEPITAVGDLVGDTVTVTYDIPGAVGNSIDTTETCVNASWGAITLAGGVGVVIAEALTALETAINTSGTESVTAVKNLGESKMVVTADVAGVLGNSIDTTETCVNASWGSATLTGGQDGTYADSVGVCYQDDDYIYISTGYNNETGNNWRRASKSVIY